MIKFNEYEIYNTGEFTPIIKTEDIHVSSYSNSSSYKKIHMGKISLNDYGVIVNNMVKEHHLYLSMINTSPIAIKVITEDDFNSDLYIDDMINLTEEEYKEIFQFWYNKSLNKNLIDKIFNTAKSRNKVGRQYTKR